MLYPLKIPHLTLIKVMLYIISYILAVMLITQAKLKVALINLNMLFLLWNSNLIKSHLLGSCVFPALSIVQCLNKGCTTLPPGAQCNTALHFYPFFLQ